MNTTETIKNRLIFAATAYDRKQSTRRGYNHYALGQYFQRIDEVIADIERGAEPRQALLCAFSDRLLSALLKGIGEPDFTMAELEKAQGSTLSYRPATGVRL